MNNVPRHIMDEAYQEYPINLRWIPEMNGTYDINEYKREGFIKGRMKSDGEFAIEFAEWMLIHASMYYYDGWNWLHNDGMLSSAELYAIFLQSKQNK